MSLAPATDSPLPALWREPAPRHFDSAIRLWIKLALVALITVVAILWIDQPLALFARNHPIPDIGRAAAAGKPHTDAGRELMLLEQWGQPTCTVAVLFAVALLDPI